MANLKSEHKYHFSYKTTNIVNGKYYIGVHNTDDLNDGYLGSGVILNKAIKKYGKNQFNREIIKHYSTSDEAFAHEMLIVNEEVINDNESYNLALGGDGSVGLLAKNQVTVIDEDGTTLRVGNNDSRFLSGELVGVTKGRPQKQVQCPHCNTIGACGPMAQNHFNYCKKNPNRIEKPKIKYKETICPFCNKQGREVSMRRFHFEYCKHNPDRIPIITPLLKEYVCPYCGKIGKGGAMKTRHFENCKENPNRPIIEKVKHKTQICPYCGTIGKGGAMKQWHFDNCKQNPNR